MSPKRAVWTDAETRKSPSSLLSLSLLLFDDTSLVRCVLSLSGAPKTDAMGAHTCLSHFENVIQLRALTAQFGVLFVSRWRLTVHALRVTYTILLTIHEKYDASCVFLFVSVVVIFFFASSLQCLPAFFLFFFFCDANRFDITHSLCADSVKEPSNKCAEWRTLEWPQKPKSRTSAVRACVCVCGRSP